MPRLLISLLLTLVFCLTCTSVCLGVVEVGPLGKDPLVIEDVYQREGTSFVAIDEVLVALELEGDWNSVKHIYRIRTPHGWAVISPGSQFLRLGDNFVPVAHRPRFIDGKLRVSEEFLLRQLSPLLSHRIYYRNHNPAEAVEAPDPLDRLFSFLLRKKEGPSHKSQRVVAIDPGHGGQDPGSLGLGGVKEKAFNLEVAQRLEKLLKMHQDAPVVLTRNDDYAVDPQRRLEIVAEAGADVMLSLHAQTCFATQTNGVMLYVQQSSWRTQEMMAEEDTSLTLAELLRAKLTAAGFQVAAVQELPVLPLGQGNLPRVLVEMGNLANSDDLTQLQDATRQQDLARALFDGLQQYFTTHQEQVDEYPSHEPPRQPEG